jgi:cleavage stimulation factor subunit 1
MPLSARLPLLFLSGDFVLVGTEQNFVRLYDVQTFSAYVSPDFSNFHAGSITATRFHPIRGSNYVTASTDGSVKLWDGVSNLLIRTIPAAHGGAEVSSVEYSPSGKYILTSGKDSTARLWDVDSARCLMTYHGVKHQSSHVKAQFEHSGEFVMCGDEASTGLAVWVSRGNKTQCETSSVVRLRADALLLFARSVQDTRTSEMVRRLDFHARVIRSVGVSPTEAAFITCGDDNRARFWSI